MIADIQLPQFTQADILRVLPIPAKTLQNWSDPSRGILRLEMQDPGKGRRRLYSMVDVIGVSIMLQLSYAKIPPLLSSKLFYNQIRYAILEYDPEHHVGQFICRIEIGKDEINSSILRNEKDFIAYSDSHEYLYEMPLSKIDVDIAGTYSFVSGRLNDIMSEEITESEMTTEKKAVYEMRKHLQKQRFNSSGKKD